MLLQDRADRAVFLADDRVVARKSGPDFTDHAEAGHVVVAPGDQGRAGRRAQRRRVEIRVAQPAVRDAIQGGCRDDAAERAVRGIAGVVHHDEQHVRRALRRHDAWRPPAFRLRGLFLDLAAELRIGRRQLLAVQGGGGAGRTQGAGDMLRRGGARARGDGERRGNHSEYMV